MSFSNAQNSQKNLDLLFFKWLRWPDTKNEFNLFSLSLNVINFNPKNDQSNQLNRNFFSSSPKSLKKFFFAAYKLFSVKEMISRSGLG